MPDYHEMYLKIFGATERAIEILIEAQREAEEIYIAPKEVDIRVLPDKEE